MNGQVLAAFITTGGAVLVAIIAACVNLCRLKRTMTAQHDQNRASTVENGAVLATKIDILHDDVRDVATRIDGHMRDHAPTLGAMVVPHPTYRMGGDGAAEKNATSGNAA